MASYTPRPDATVDAMQVQAPTTVNADDRTDGVAPEPPGNIAGVAHAFGLPITVGHDRAYEIEVPTAHGPVYARGGDWVFTVDGGPPLLLDDATFTALFTGGS